MKTDKVSFVNFRGSMIPKSKKLMTHCRLYNTKSNKQSVPNKSFNIKKAWAFIKETLDEVTSFYNF